ncbi:hypothetical protein P885DRAFT_61236 [Corynascus similis CBS 632.67]
MMLPALALVSLARLASAVPAASNSTGPATTTPVSTELVALGGFWNSCRECNLWYWTINCVCDGEWTSCDLNPYISNNDGTLVWYGSGLGGSCSGCNLQSATLGCNCRKLDGSTNWGTINLTKHLCELNRQPRLNDGESDIVRYLRTQKPHGERLLSSDGRQYRFPRSMVGSGDIRCNEDGQRSRQDLEIQSVWDPLPTRSGRIRSALETKRACLRKIANIEQQQLIKLRNCTAHLLRWSNHPPRGPQNGGGGANRIEVRKKRTLGTTDGADNQTGPGKSALQALLDAISEQREVIANQQNVICELRDVVSKQQTMIQDFHSQFQEHQRQMEGAIADTKAQLSEELKQARDQIDTLMRNPG